MVGDGSAILGMELSLNDMECKGNKSDDVSDRNAQSVSATEGPDAVSCVTAITILATSPVRKSVCWVESQLLVDSAAEGAGEQVLLSLPSIAGTAIVYARTSVGELAG